MIIYKWTGISKLPEHGDWYLNFDGLPKQMDKTMTTGEPDRPYFILDRIEKEEN